MSYVIPGSVLVPFVQAQSIFLYQDKVWEERN